MTWKLKLGVLCNAIGIATAMGMIAAMFLSLVYPGLRDPIVGAIPYVQVVVPAFVMVGILLIVFHLLPEIVDEAPAGDEAA